MREGKSTGRGAARAIGKDPARFGVGFELAIYLFTLALLCWPLVINGRPFYSADSASYLRGGELGFKTGLAILERPFQRANPSAAEDPQAVVSQAISKSGGARSAIYSVVAYLFRGPGESLLALAIGQAAVVALMITSLRRLIAPQSELLPTLATTAALALFTSAGWSAAYAVPDIFAGIAVGAAAMLTVYFEALSNRLRCAFVALIAFCITVHGSHLPITIITLIAGSIVSFRPKRLSWRRAAIFASPVLAGVAAILVTSYAAFGELSLAPKRYPIQLARSVADGPGAWYLHDHCATEHYAICEVFGPNPPRNVGEFLWGDNGVRNRATPEQMDRIRAEESTIVRRAALAYPGTQITRSASNALLQVVTFGTKELVFGQEVMGDGRTLVQIGPDRSGLKVVGKILIYLSFIASIVFLIVVRRRVTPREMSLVGAVVIGLLANAAVCGVLSGVADRYQGRVAWVLPAVAVMIFLRLLRGTKPAETSANVTLA